MQGFISLIRRKHGQEFGGADKTVYEILEDVMLPMIEGNHPRFKKTIKKLQYKRCNSNKDWIAAITAHGINNRKNDTSYRVMKMIHIEVRKKIVEARKNGITVKEICRVNNVGKSAVYELLKQERETGDIEPKTHLRGRKQTISAEDLKAIEDQIKIQCDITASEIKENLGLSLCESSICKIIRHKLGYRYKKRQYTPVNGNAPM